MDNNQFQKNVYQVPASHSGESLDVLMAPVEVPISQAEVDQRFSTIAREEVLQAFNKMTQDLEMSVSGFEHRTQPEIQLSEPHPVAIEIGKIAVDLQQRRYIYLEYLLSRAKEMGLVERAKLKLLLSPKDVDFYFHPTIDKIIERESQNGHELFEHDADVKEIKYFLHENDWFHQQVSANKMKNFTNKYEVTDDYILKSSTFYHQDIGAEVMRTVYVDDVEAQNLLIASKKYYEKVTGKVYIKTPSPRFRFGSKSDYDLTS
ncbi:MAG: hypothetical protein EOT05_00205 [Candidatus Microsaccharimonas sossegonensis]|uniref:Uncharacterized protein n=1 Tax=Candidatus Microsaccharimonas sossegonensis TaxID=2506948 RepID=A0A4Q0AGB9_9BACT|nr:MAG: hypothetical protein EOT05_00205 [Candidatus Microsaccharimonas sossegonensis]